MGDPGRNPDRRRRGRRRRRSSHGGDPVDLDVTHRTVAVSAYHFLAVDYRRLGGDALQTVLGYRAAAATSADPPHDEAEDAQNGDHHERSQRQLQRRQLQQHGAMREGLVVTGRAVGHPVAPKGGVYTGVQFRATLLAVPRHLQSRC